MPGYPVKAHILCMKDVLVEDVFDLRMHTRTWSIKGESCHESVTNFVTYSIQCKSKHSCTAHTVTFTYGYKITSFFVLF
jgi:hypothetical protein